MKRSVAALGLAVVLACAASPVLAATQNVVVNGDFETSDFTGWTNTCAGLSYNTFGGLGAGDLPINNPTRWAMLNTQGTAPTSCEFYQTVTIPADATAATLQMQYALTGSNAGGAGDTRTIAVTDATGATILVVIQPVVNRSTTRAFAPLGAPVDLIAYAGQTIRIRARLTHNSGDNSANVVGLDDVVLIVTTPNPVPTVSEWTMILLGLALAGGAGVVLQRRRVAI